MGATDEAADRRGRGDEGRRQRDARPQQPQSKAGRATVRCEYPKCGHEAEPAEAKRSFKVCHNCACAYCSRECRQRHWERHRKACLQSRASELCHRILEAIKADGELRLAASRLARRGFLERGRGCVKYYFHSPQLAEQFAAAAAAATGAGGGDYPEAAYVEWSRLEPHELGDELHSGLVRVCKSYNADTRLVVLVAVHVVAEAPSSGGCVKWERRIVFRYAKTKLSPQLLRADGRQPAADAQPPATLVLTSLPGLLPTCRKQREVTFTHIQRQLRQRGVSLRKQFPDVYRRLCDYVEGDAFTPTTVYPVDAASAKTFMCVIMPDGEPRHVDLSPTGDNSRPRAVHLRRSATADQST